MIYTDGIHMMSDESLEELHEFAKKIGLKRHRFHNHPRHPHYDLTKERERFAYLYGAKKVSSKSIVQHFQECNYIITE